MDEWSKRKGNVDKRFEKMGKVGKEIWKSDKVSKEIWGKSIAREVTDLPDDTAASDGRDAPSVRFWNMSNIWTYLVGRLKTYWFSTQFSQDPILQATWNFLKEILTTN